MPRIRLRDIQTDVASRVRAQRRALDMTQAALAEALGVTQQQVQRYECAMAHLTADRLYQVASVLGVHDMNFFFTNIQEPQDVP